MPKGNPGVPKKPRKAPKRGAAERAAVVKQVERVRKQRASDRRKKKEQTYYKAWYKDNKDRVLEERKTRYANDEIYRKRIKESVKRSKDRRKKVTKNRKKRETTASRLPTPKTMPWEGDTLTLVSFGALLQEVGLNRLTLRTWLRTGALPPCVVVDENGHQWFPTQYVSFVRDMVALREDLRLEGGKQWFLSHFRKIAWGKFFDQRRKIPDLCGVLSNVNV